MGWEETTAKTWFGDEAAQVVAILGSRGSLREKEIWRDLGASFSGDRSRVRRVLALLVVYGVVRRSEPEAPELVSEVGPQSKGKKREKSGQCDYTLCREALWLRWRAPRILRMVTRVCTDDGCADVMQRVLEKGQAWRHELVMGGREPSFLELMEKRLLVRVVDGVDPDSDSRVARKKRKAEGEVSLPQVEWQLWALNMDVCTRFLTCEMLVGLVRTRVDDRAASIIHVALDQTLLSKELDEVEPSRLRSKVESKVVHRDQLKRLLELRKDAPRVTQAQLSHYLTVLSRPEYGYLQPSSSSAVSFCVDLRRLAWELKKRMTESFVETTFGASARRVFRLLCEKKFIDQKQVGDLAMLPSKAAREALYELHLSGLIQMQEIPTTDDFKTSRSFFLWNVNMTHSSCSLLEKLYIMAANLAIMMSTCSADKNITMGKRRDMMEKLDVSIIRIDRMVHVLRDLGA